MPRALIVIDMINRYDHEDAEACIRNARDAVPRMAELIEHCRETDIPVIYVNDHYGIWNGDRDALVESALDLEDARPLVEPVLPRDDDMFVMKARHSIFYETSLGYLLNQLEAERLTFVGQVTEQCVLYSALDAYVRHHEVEVVTDAVIAIEDELADASLRMMERNMHATLVTAGELIG